MEPRQMQKYIDEIFRRESDFSELAIHYAKKAHPIFSRFMHQYGKYEPAIQHEASHLIKAAVVMALAKIGNPTPEQIRVADAIVWYLYDAEIQELYRLSKSYVINSPAEDFCRTVWTMMNAPEDIEAFVGFCMNVHRQVQLVAELFVPFLLDLANEPENDFAAFVESVFQLKS